MNKKMRKCAVCRSEYTYCPRCNEDKDKPNWYFAFCSSNCKDIYETTSSFENNWISRDEARAELDKLDLSKADTFGTSYKSSIEKIYITNDVVIENVLTSKDVEESELVNEIEPESEEETEIKKPKRAKKNVE